MNILRLMAVATLGMLLVFAASARPAERVALVVGNSAYEHTDPLVNPKNDASDVAEVLAELGFQVIVGTDLDLDGFYEKIEEFAAAAHHAEVSMFFYAGHGLQVLDKNYLAPVDTILEKKLDLRRRAIELDVVLGEMRSQTNLVFLDACRNNPLAGELARSMGLSRAQSANRGLARVEGGSEMFIAYATAPGEVAQDGQGRNSPFTAALLEHIRTPGQSVDNLLISVTGAVKARTNGQQVPWRHSSLSTIFEFSPIESMTFGVIEIDSVMWTAQRVNVRSGPGTSYEKVASLEAGKAVTVTGRVKNRPWLRIDVEGRGEGFVHAPGLTGEEPRPAPGTSVGPQERREPGVYLTVDVSTGEWIIPEHLRVVGADRIPAGEIRNYAMVAGGCYARSRSAGGRLAWLDVSARCSQ